jgi:hypothetical protein
MIRVSAVRAKNTKNVTVSKLEIYEDKQSINIAEATCFGDEYNLNWERGTQIKTVQAHVRLEVIMVVDEMGEG